ncbi:MAG: MATE family efflux transporter [Lachnospiraceae bacterium]|nr:MATE family efflux transporter [Lachnospiraceae bacterium]
MPQQGAQAENAITTGVIWKQILVFFLPIVAGSVFQQLYNMVDTIVVGHYVGTHALAAVGNAGLITQLIVGFFVGVASGATVVTAQYYGAGLPGRVSDAVHTAMALSLVFGALVTGLGILTARPLLLLIRQPAELIDDTVLYLRVFYAGVTGAMVYNMGTGILRSVGDSKRPLYILIAASLVNVVLDLLFVLVFHWGIFGVALATVLSEFISALLIVICLFRTNDSYKLHLRKLRLHWRIFLEIIRIGLPGGFESILYVSSTLIIQSAVNGFGTSIIAAWSTTGKIDSVVWLVMQAFGIAITTFIGQNFGAQRYDRVKQCVRTGLLMNFASIAVLSVFVYFTCPFLMRIFTDDTEVIYWASYIMRYFAPFYVVYVVISVLSSTIRACGEAFPPMLVTTLGICGFRIFWMFAVLPHRHTLGMVSLSFGTSWILTATVFTIYYLRMRWMKRCIARMEGYSVHGRRL